MSRVEVMPAKWVHYAPCCVFTSCMRKRLFALCCWTLVSDAFQEDQLGAVCWNVESARGVTGLLYNK